MLFLINGQRTLEDLCRDSEEDPLTVYRVVYGLDANNLIEQVAVDAQGVTGSVEAVGEDTLRQAYGDALVSDATIVDHDDDDTSLVVSSDAKLAYKDVVRKTVAQLAIENGDLAGTVLLLTDPEYTIGRQSDNTIQITDLGISGHHARIFRGPEGYVIEDLKSRNGTWLNGTRVFHAVLQNLDAVRVGSTDLKYQVLYDGLPSRPGVTSRP